MATLQIREKKKTLAYEGYLIIISILIWHVWPYDVFKVNNYTIHIIYKLCD